MFRGVPVTDKNLVLVFKAAFIEVVKILFTSKIIYFYFFENSVSSYISPHVADPDCSFKALFNLDNFMRLISLVTQ